MSTHLLPSENDQSQNADGAGLSCSEIDALLPAYAIGATDATEAAVIKAHLHLCPIHTTELAKYKTLAQSLLANIAPVQPPARIANQIRRAIDQPLTRLQPQPTLGASSQPRWGTWRWSALWAAAAVAAVLLLAGLNFYWIRQNLQLRQAYDHIAALHAEQAADLQSHAEVHALLTTAGIQFLDLPAIQQNSPSSAEVVWNPQLKIAMLYVEEFPQAAPEQVYQLWLTYNGQRQSGGHFRVDSNGNGVHIFPLPHSLEQAEIIGITLEPAGGSAAPTSAPVVRWQL